MSKIAKQPNNANETRVSVAYTYCSNSKAAQLRIKKAKLRALEEKQVALALAF